MTPWWTQSSWQERSTLQRVASFFPHMLRYYQLLCSWMLRIRNSTTPWSCQSDRATPGSPSQASPCSSGQNLLSGRHTSSFSALSQYEGAGAGQLPFKQETKGQFPATAVGRGERAVVPALFLFSSFVCSDLKWKTCYLGISLLFGWVVDCWCLCTMSIHGGWCWYRRAWRWADTGLGPLSFLLPPLAIFWLEITTLLNPRDVWLAS